MELFYAAYALEFKYPFGLAHGSRTYTDVVYARLTQDGLSGYGEAALPPYLGETQSSVIAFFKKASETVKNCKLPFSVEEIVSKINLIETGNTAAKAALDIALYDLLGKFTNKPVYELLEIEKPQPKDTSVTISIGKPDLIPQKIQELSEYKILKVKLGSGSDKEIVEYIRKYTNKPIVVDVNQGWPDKHFALEMIHWLAGKNVLFVEQPLKKDNYRDIEWLTAQSPLPTLADESMQRLADLDKVAACFSGINLKLMKCTGIFEAKKIIERAKAKGLKINIGCMSESTCGIAAAAQFMNHADWIDLDGPLLIKNDPFKGLDFKNGKLVPNNAAGTGAELKDKALDFIK